MTGRKPLVSIIIPAHDSERYLEAALRSVLDQTWREVEAIVVDDGSQDGTLAIARRVAAEDDRVRVIAKEHGGVSAARNAGLAAARGEYLGFLDSDDVMLPDKVERQARFLELFPSADLVYSDLYLGASDGTPTRFISKRPPVHPARELLVYRNWLGMGGPLLRASLQRKVGFFDEGLANSEDWDFWIRCAEHGRLVYMPGPVFVYRQHDRQASDNWEGSRRGCLTLIERHRPARTREWRAARAALAWRAAQRHWGRREPLSTLVALGESLWHARSRRTLKDLKAVLAPDR